MEPFLAQIVMFAGNFAPRGWAYCDGQLLAISQYSALFSLLGTTYGGDGRSTFALPDLRGRLAMHPGNGPGLTPRSLGQRGGSEQNTLTANQMPSHNHALAANEEANADDPNGSFIAGTGAKTFASTGGATMNAASIGNTGGGQSVNNIQPFECVNFIIALQGTYPSRN